MPIFTISCPILFSQSMFLSAFIYLFTIENTFVTTIILLFVYPQHVLHISKQGDFGRDNPAGR